MAREAEVYGALLAAVQSDRISGERLDEAARHVLALHARFGGLPAGQPADVTGLVRRIALAAIAPEGSLPALNAACALFLPAGLSDSAPEHRLPGLLADRGIAVRTAVYDAARPLAFDDGCALVVVTDFVTYGASGAGTAFIATRSPYVLAGHPAGAPVVATFGALDAQLEALADALVGTLEPTGSLPAGVRSGP